MGTYEVFLRHHINVLKRITARGNAIEFLDEAKWLGCRLNEELKVLEDELVDIILLAE
jgi:hypothetical protein